MEERQRFTGKNEEQALERAARVLGVPRDELDWTLVSQEKGFLGLGGSATIEVVVPTSPAPAPAPAPAPPRTPPRTPKPSPSPPPRSSDDRPRPGRDRDRGRSGRDDRGRGGRDGRDRDRGGVDGRDRSRDHRDDGPVDEAELERRLVQAREVATSLLEQMGWEANITVERQGRDRILIKVDDTAADLADDGRDLVDAYQFLLNKIVNRFPPRYRIQVDVAGMLEKFDAELTQRAKEWCQEVLETGNELWVEEELNPRDRRLVHIEVKTHDGIDSRSEGMGRDRKICIFRV
ncbi:MAG: Jag N-terminal domain-containing protein [Pseudomonadota bacterium]